MNPLRTKLPAAAAATAIFLAISPAAPAAPMKLTDCDCKNLREMRDRWCSARAARSEYERIMAFLKAEAAKPGAETRMFSNSDKQMINQVCVQDAINDVSDWDVADKAGGATQENLPTQTLIGMDECRIEVKNPNKNKCLQQIVEAHELYHARECRSRTDLWQSFDPNVRTTLQAMLFGPVNTTVMTVSGDTKYSLTSAQFAAEEAASYTREIVTINARWKELQKSCAAKDFEVEMYDANSVGPSIWNNAQPDASGKRFYKMFDPSVHPCPYRPRPTPSACTLK